MTDRVIEIVTFIRAKRTADEMAEQMRCQLQHSTPEELGWPDLTPEELVAAEWRCWFDEEMNCEPELEEADDE
jgi:hypothetical protein